MTDKDQTIRPLQDVVVLDLTTALAGPFATLLLAGLGAKVIKVENPVAGDTCRANAPYWGKDGLSLVKKEDDDISVSALNRLRNKQAITLNLKHPEAKAVLADLVRKSDVVFENFSRGVLDKFGADYETLSAINSRLVYCSISGFGREAEGTGKAMDTIIQALSGLMYTSGLPDESPVRIGVSLADLITPLFAVIGVLAALHQRNLTGRGQCVDVSMLGAMTSLVAAEHLDLLERVGIPMRSGQTAARLAPFGIYQAKDGYVAICAPMDQMARKFFAAIGRDDLLTDERFSTRDQRVLHRAALDQLVNDWAVHCTIKEIVALLEPHDIPVAPVLDPASAMTDRRVIERKEIVRLQHPKYGANETVFGTGLPILFSDAQAGFDQIAPAIGQHNETIYQDWLGYSADKLNALKSKGVI